MPKRLSPTEFVVAGSCSQRCSLNKVNLGEKRHALVMDWYQMGYNDFKIEELARAAGMKMSHGAIGRHRKSHLIDKATMKTDESLAELDDIEALDLILERGQTQIKGWKITPSEYFKAMEMKYKLTQGSTMDAMYAALAAAGAEEDAETEDRPEDLEEVSGRPGDVREDVPMVTPASGSDDLATWVGRTHEYPSAGEPLGEDVRHRDEAHLGEHLQEGSSSDESEGMVGTPVPDSLDST
jgi:hypothetical protein